MSRQGRSGAGKTSGELQKLQKLFTATQDYYGKTELAKTVSAILRTKAWPYLTKAISLGLGGLTSTDQSRRIKQLVLFMALVQEHAELSGTQLKLYAQDPTFTKSDEVFLQSLGIEVLRTADKASIGEAETIIDEHTLLYTPFLTLEAYKALFESCSVSYMIGDDFNALKAKWPKHTTERADVEYMIRHRLTKHRRRAIDAGDFWMPDEKPFPMAAYLLLTPKLLSESTHQGE